MLTPFEAFMLFAIACALWFIWVAIAVLANVIERTRAIMEELLQLLRGRA